MIGALVFLIVAGLTLALYGALLLCAPRPWQQLRSSYTADKLLDYHGIPFIVDQYCPKGTFYLVDTKYRWGPLDDAIILHNTP